MQGWAGPAGDGGDGLERGVPRESLALKQHKWCCDFGALAKGCVFLCSSLVMEPFHLGGAVG